MLISRLESLVHLLIEWALACWCDICRLVHTKIFWHSNAPALFFYAAGGPCDDWRSLYKSNGHTPLPIVNLWCLAKMLYFYSSSCLYWSFLALFLAFTHWAVFAILSSKKLLGIHSILIWFSKEVNLCSEIPKTIFFHLSTSSVWSWELWTWSS